MSQRVLILDDEPVIANTLEAILRSAGYEAKATYSAEQALELIAGWQPDFAIVDVILPLLNGIEFSKLLRGSFPECGVLLFSGETRTAEILEQTEKEGYKFEVMAKPVHPEILLEKTAEALACIRGQPVEPASDQVEPTASVPTFITTQDSRSATAQSAIPRQDA